MAPYPGFANPVARSRLALVWLGVLAVVWAWAAYKPVFRHDWLLENILVFITVPVLAYVWWRRPVSDLAWTLVSLFLALHIVGSHWTYSNVPIPWEQWGFERNHYDRVVHFLYGFLLVQPIKEVLGWRPDVYGRWAWVLALQFIVASSALYEMIEWVAVEAVDPEAGAAFLGTQGDEFDAIKDMALAMGGGFLVAAVGMALPRRAIGSASTA